jgi:hypothetical protein
LAAGEFVVPDSFDDPLPENVLRGFRGNAGDEADGSGKADEDCT